MPGAIRTKRIYDDASPDDGVRVLTDRLWPRGVKKEDAAVDTWLKDAAPSSGLRKWFKHDPEKWDEFRERYRAELDGNREALEPVLERLRAGETVTLLYGATDREHNHALVLKEQLAALANT